MGDSVTEKVSEKLDGSKTIFEARRNYFNLDSIITSLCKDPKWNDKDLFDDNRDKSVKVDANQGLCKYYRGYRHGKVSTDTVVTRICFNPETCTYVFNDCKKDFVGRIQNYTKGKVNENYSSQVYVYNGEKIEDFLELLGGASLDDVILMSTIEKPFKNRASGNRGGSIPCWMFDVDAGKFVDTKMSVKYEDAIYLEESRGKINICGNVVSIYKANEIISSLIKLGFDPEGTIYTAKPSVIEGQKLAERKNWRAGNDLIKESFEEIFKDKKDDYLLVENECYFNKYSFAHKAFKDQNDEVYLLVKEYEDYKEMIDKARLSIKGMVDLVDSFAFSFSVSDYTGKYKNNHFNNTYDRLTRKYSILEKINYYEEIAIKYIEEMNELFKLRENQKLSLDNK
jgi:hypothetical protein